MKGSPGDPAQNGQGPTSLTAADSEVILVAMLFHFNFPFKTHCPRVIQEAESSASGLKPGIANSKVFKLDTTVGALAEQGHEEGDQEAGRVGEPGPLTVSPTGSVGHPVLRRWGRGLGLPRTPGDIGWPPSAVRFYTPRCPLRSLPFPLLPIC